MRKFVNILIFALFLSTLHPITSASSARSCSATADPSVDYITISPSGPLSMPADQALNITAIAYNSAGAQLNVPIAWSSTSGSIQNFGGGQARWSPQMVGSQSVTACNGDVHVNLNVNVQPGDPLTFELTVLEDNYTADETFEITPLLRDQFGNSWIPNIPYANWTLPDGMSISLPNDGSPPIVTPGPTGIMTVGIDWDGWSSMVSFNVTRGVAIGVSISHDSPIVSSDDIVELCAHHYDQRGNSWLTNASWLTQGGLANDALSSFTGECVDFDAGLVGNWVVEVEDGFGLVDSLTLTVTQGRLAHISLEHLANTMHIGDFYLLEADGFDAAGNPVTVDTWNWSVTSGPSTEAIVAEGDGIVFTPNLVGQHTIQVTAAGRVQAIDVEVLAGVPVSLEIDVIDAIPGTLNIVTGSSLDLILYGVDDSGNRNPVDAPISDWFILNDYGIIENSSVGGTGHYTYTSSGIGDVSITVFLDQAQGDLHVHILQGPLDYLEVNLPPEADQGTTIEFEVSGFDVSGNPVPIHQCSAIITTDAGVPECDVNGWELHLKESGELAVHARVQSTVGTSAEGSDFISVQPTWFGWGNNTQVIIAFSLILVLTISIILVLLSRHLDLRISEESEDEVQPVEDAPVQSPSITSIGASPPPPLPVASASTIVANHPLPAVESPPPVPISVTPLATIPTIHSEEIPQKQDLSLRAEGPRNSEGHSLRPLPGTTAGQDGWYFDRQGRPTHWRHSENTGWLQE